MTVENTSGRVYGRPHKQRRQIRLINSAVTFIMLSFSLHYTSTSSTVKQGLLLDGGDERQNVRTRWFQHLFEILCLTWINYLVSWQRATHLMIIIRQEGWLSEFSVRRMRQTLNHRGEAVHQPGLRLTVRTSAVLASGNVVPSLLLRDRDSHSRRCSTDSL